MITITSREGQCLAVLVARFTEQAFSARSGDVTTELHDGSSVVTGELAAARHLCYAAKRQDELLGVAGSAQMDEVEEWLEATARHGAAHLAPLVESRLGARTYLAGSSFTLADIAVYASLRDAGVLASSPNVSRWGALVCSLLGVSPPAHSASSSAAAATLAAAAVAPPAAAAAGAAAIPSAPPAAAETPVAAPAAPSEGGAGVGGEKKEKRARGPVGGTGRPAGKPEAVPAPSRNIGGGGDVGSMPMLEGAEMGKVVTRFPPEPSGYLHIGHVKAVLLNNYYARAYEGRLVIRFDDTNPSKEKDEYEQNIIADLASLGIKGDLVSHTSDYFDLIADYARQMIRDGKAFMDDTPQDQMRDQRMKMLNSARRDTDVATNLARFEVMLGGGPVGSVWCLRAKMDMQDPNGTCRDPVIYRVNETPHHRMGTKYRAYPTYDFACPIVDAIEGVTHALRSSEYHDRDKQFYWMLGALGLRKVLIQDFSRLNFNFTLLSKRKLNWFVENKVVDGWYDPRFPTVQGMLRRGLVVPALREFILSMGASKRGVDMEWDKFWATNKKHIDPTAARYTVLVAAERVPLLLTEGEGLPGPGGAPEVRSLPLHPKDAALGTKSVFFSAALWLEAVDADGLTEGEEVTLMKWGNAVISRVVRSGEVVTALEARLHLAGDFKKTEKKLTWLSAARSASDASALPAELGTGLVGHPSPAGTEPLGVPLTLVEYDSLITVPKLEEGDDFTAAINPVTEIRTPGVGEHAMLAVKAGDIVQLERKGYYRCDAAYGGPGSAPAVLFFIPDGKVKGMYNLKEKLGVLEARAAARLAALRSTA